MYLYCENIGQHHILSRSDLKGCGGGTGREIYGTRGDIYGTCTDIYHTCGDLVLKTILVIRLGPS
jgi:hypothetical protein